MFPVDSQQRTPAISEEVDHKKIACLLNLLSIALKFEFLHDRGKTVTEKIRQTHKKRHCIILTVNRARSSIMW